MATLFSHLLVLVTLITGLVWAFDHYVLLPKRREKLATIEAVSPLDDEARASILREGPIAENCHSVFPVLAVVLVLRSFIYEPFQIPSGSMKPTLLVGDFILVEKFSYGLRDPVFRHKFWETGEPERGDVAVFKYPIDGRTDYIKRIIGLPGDRVIYNRKTLYIQPACKAGMTPCPELQQIAVAPKGVGEFYEGPIAQERYQSDLLGLEHDILINPQRREPVHAYFSQAGNQVGEWLVPEGQYFVMGDNRDNSTDGRFWGFVDESHLVGKAVFIWISFERERSEDSWLPSWIPSGVRFSRVGALQ